MVLRSLVTYRFVRILETFVLVRANLVIKFAETLAYYPKEL